MDWSATGSQAKVDSKKKNRPLRAVVASFIEEIGNDGSMPSATLRCEYDTLRDCDDHAALLAVERRV